MESRLRGRTPTGAANGPSALADQAQGPRRDRRADALAPLDGQAVGFDAVTEDDAVLREPADDLKGFGIAECAFGERGAGGRARPRFAHEECKARLPWSRERQGRMALAGQAG